MKRVLLMALLLPALVFAQKPLKPNLNKALSSWKDGKLDEAKEMIDLCVTTEKIMTDGKAWYYRGLIYASLDTSKNEAYKALAPDALKTSIESFAKADQLQTKAGSDYFLPPDATNPMPVTKTQQCTNLANIYLQEGIDRVQNDEYEASVGAMDKCISVFEGTLTQYDNDTLAYFVMCLAASSAEMYDKIEPAVKKYYEKGGKSKDAYIVLYQVYTGPKEDKEKALAVVRDARKALPDNTDFPRMEIGLLIDLERIEEAKDGLEQAVAANPDDKILRFYLGYTYGQLKDYKNAEKQYTEALRIDPAYFEAAYYLAQIYLTEVDNLTKEINNLGISDADNKRKPQLYQARVKACETAIPYLERAEKMKAPTTESQIELLEKLQMLYYYVADDAKEKVVRAKLKALGADVD